MDYMDLAVRCSRKAVKLNHSLTQHRCTSDDGLVLKWQQAVAWINEGPVHWHMHRWDIMSYVRCDKICCISETSPCFVLSILRSRLLIEIDYFNSVYIIIWWLFIVSDNGLGLYLLPIIYVYCHKYQIVVSIADIFQGPNWSTLK